MKDLRTLKASAVIALLICTSSIGLAKTVQNSYSQNSKSPHSARQRKELRDDQARGKSLFRANACLDCHSINGVGCTEGVSLSSVGLRRDRQFMLDQLKDPEEHVRKNAKAFHFDTNMMTNANLSAQEASLIVTYLQTLRKPTGKTHAASEQTGAGADHPRD